MAILPISMFPMQMIDDLFAERNRGDKAVVYLLEYRLVPET